MSQNKTVIQGLEPADAKATRNPYDTGQTFYTRGNNAASKGTIVPGMMENPSQQATPSQDYPNPRSSYNNPPKKMQSGKPIVGFLYSVSKTGLGEYWPLQLGKNSIGQSKDSDIVLSEGTVSSNHAVIIIRQGKNGIIAAIKDSESTNGTMINGEPIDFAAEECHDGDIITIGKNYEFIFVLIDANKKGLSTNPNFITVESDNDDFDDEDNFYDIPSFNNNPTRHGGDPFNDGPTAWGTKGNYGNPSNGTVGMDGSISGGNHGGTVPM